MNKVFDDQIVQKINSSHELTVEERRQLIKEISEKGKFALVDLLQGFPKEHEDSQQYKKPVRKNWESYPTQDNANFGFSELKERAGILCGEKSGLIVLDIDNIQKFLSWAKARGIENPIPETFTVNTRPGTDRNHYYFKFPGDGKEYRNRSEKETFDIRSTAGQVLCPGSIHPETHQPYTVIANHEIVEAPEWLREYSHDKIGFEKKYKAKKPMIDHYISPDGSVDIEKLQISAPAKEKIQKNHPVGQRSEQSGSVLLSLIRAKVPEEVIRKVFADYPIGDKARERPEWFEKEIETARQRIEATTKTPEKKNYYEHTYVCTIGEILIAPDTFEYLIENFWPKGENLLITGKGGTGKSLFALNMALDLTLQPGLPFLNKFAVPNKKKVLFVQSENTYLGTKKRFLKICQSYPQYNTITSEIYFMGWNQDIRVYGDFNEDSHFREAIDRSINRIEPDIVIMDPLISFHRKDENSNDKMRYVLDDISQFFANRKVDLCLIHHESKSGQSGARGASAISDWAANCFTMLKNDKNDINKLTLKHIKARNFDINPDFDLESDNLRFHVKGTLAQGPTQSTGQPTVHNHILQILESYPGNTSSSGVGDIFEDVKKIYENAGDTLSRSVFNRNLSELEASGKIKLQKNGRIKNYLKI